MVHLDQEFWRPGWEPTDIPRRRTRVTELVAADRWVLDGNYGGSLDLRLPRTELIVFLDLPRRVTIPRVLRRWARWRGRTRPDMHPGCLERVTGDFVAWLWRFPHEGKHRLLIALAATGADERTAQLPGDQSVGELPPRLAARLTRHRNVCRDDLTKSGRHAPLLCTSSQHWESRAVTARTSPWARTPWQAHPPRLGRGRQAVTALGGNSTRRQLCVPRGGAGPSVAGCRTVVPSGV